MAGVTLFTKLRLCLFIAFSLILFWNLTLYLSVDRATTSHLLFSAGYGSLYLLSAFIGLWGVFKFGLVSSIGRSLLFLSLGLIASGVALCIWSYYGVVLGVDVPFPSLSDAFFVLFFPLISFSFFSLLQTYKLFLSRRLLIEGTIIFLITAYIVFRFIVQLDVSSELSNLGNWLNVFYPLADIWLISIALTALRVYGGKLRGNLYILIFALIAQALGDMFFTYRSAAGIYWNGDIADSIFMVSGFIFGLAIIQTIEDLEK